MKALTRTSATPLHINWSTSLRRLDYAVNRSPVEIWDYSASGDAIQTCTRRAFGE